MNESTEEKKVVLRCVCGQSIRKEMLNNGDYSNCTCKCGALICSVSKDKTADCACIAGGKSFDINRHEWGDFSWSINQQDRDTIELYNHETCTDDGDAELFQINKDDAIAIAKHFGLTAEDLK